MSDERDGKSVFARIPPSLWHVLDDADRPKKEIITRGIERELGVDAAGSAAVLDRKIRRKETRRDEVQDEIDDLQTIKEGLEADIRELKAARERRAEGELAYEEMLDSLLDKMERGEIEYLIAGATEISEIVEEHDRTADEVRHDLKARAAEQERGIYNTQFVEKMEADHIRRSGEQALIADAWDGGSE